MGTRPQTRFISGDAIDRVTGWNFESVDQSAIRVAEQARAEAMAEAQSREDQIRQQAYAEGFAAGHLQGVAQASAEGQRQLQDYIAQQGNAHAREFAELLQSAQAQLDAAQQVLAHGVLDLACQLAREVIREELTVNPNVLQPVIREALGLMTVDSRPVTLRLHPSDRDILAPILQEEFPDVHLNLVADAHMPRAGCVLESAGAIVDGSLPLRWSRAVSRLGLTVAWEHGDDASNAG